LLAKGDVQPPAQPIPVAALKPLIEAFCLPQGTLLDPFAGSGSSLVAARQLGRQCIGIELDEQHHRTATARLQEAQPSAALPNGRLSPTKRAGGLLPNVRVSPTKLAGEAIRLRKSGGATSRFLPNGRVGELQVGNTRLKAAVSGVSEGDVSYQTGGYQTGGERWFPTFS
jgi:hypothetical protein